MNAVLMRAVVEAVVFAGISGDEVVQPDAAVSQLEQLGAILKGLSVEERRAFDKYVRDLATAEEAESGLTERVEFLQSLVANIGLLEE